MGTQKTGRGAPPSQQEPTQPQQPGAVGETIEVAGRPIQRANMREKVAEAYAGIHGDEAHPMTGPAPTPADPAEKARVDAMMPEFLKQQAQREQQPAAGEAVENAEALKLISDRYLEAKRADDDRTAGVLKGLLDEVLGEKAPKRKREAKPQHPTLQKLKRNLGIGRIKPVQIEWGGFKWHFYPAPPATDQWVGEMMERSVSSISALKVSAALVGIDDTPLYEVFGIETTAEFVPEGGTEPIPVRVFEKRCDACGDVLDVETTECASCGSAHDPFEMPLPLRLLCVDKVHNWFMTDFGPFEELRELHVRMRAEMPDRLSDKEQLYPFLKLSPAQPPDSSETTEATDTTPPGDE